MVDTKPVFDWQGALSDTYQEITRQTIDHIPQLLGAVVLLVAGWIIASLLRLLARKVIGGLDVLLLRTSQKRGGHLPAVRSYALVGGNIVYWSVLLFFVAASANMLEWKVFADVTGALLNYIPSVLFGVLIILTGLGLSGVVRSTVVTTAQSMDIAQSDLLARTAQITVVLTAVIIGVEQLGINVAFLTTTLIVVVGVLLAGAALAFGLGARDYIANVIGAKTSSKYYQLSQLIKVGDVEGHLLEITPTAIVLDTEQGRAVIPAKLFHQQISEIIHEIPESGRSAASHTVKKNGDSNAPQ